MDTCSKWWMHILKLVILLVNINSVITSCPIECICTPLPGNKLLSTIFLTKMSPDGHERGIENVVCSNRKLSKLPENIPQDAIRLDISQNNFSQLDNLVFNFSRLQVLDISKNQISVLDNSVFNYMSHLEDLIFKNNSINIIQPETFQNLSTLIKLDLGQNRISMLKSETLRGLENLRFLNLSGNRLRAIQNQSFQDLSKLEILDLSFNNLERLHLNMFQGLTGIKQLNLSHNTISYISAQTFQLLEKLDKLDLSHNYLQSTSDFLFSGLHALRTLDLSNNGLTFMSDMTFSNVSSIKVLDLNSNPMSAINIPVFTQLPNLTTLSISKMPYLSDLSFNSFEGLDNLVSLNLSMNPQLSFINPHLFSVLPRLQTIDLHSNNITYLSALTFHSNRNLTYIDITQNSLQCSCDIAWLGEFVNDSVKCESEGDLIPISHVTNLTFPCAKPNQNVSDNKVFYQTLGSDVRLTCGVTLDPTMIVIWTTPRNKVLTYHAFHPDATKHLPDLDYINQTRDWENDTSYHSEFVYRKDRVLLLSDSSLYIDYVLRSDTGPYKCEVRNAYHNVTSVVNVWLDFAVLYDVVIFSLVIGISCAASFFVLIVVYTIVRWSTIRIINQRRRDAIRQLLEDLDTYKRNQMARIREHYSTQLTRVSENYHSQLERLRSNYSMQMGRVRRGCSHQVDRIRDNYSTQVGRLKDYSSHQIDQLRSAYNNQILKIRDFGSLQFDRLRETCKQGQLSVKKLMETMNMDNCKGIVEAECLRTDSIMFPPDFDEIQGLSLIGSESEYTTASDDTDESKSSVANTPNSDGDLELVSTSLDTPTLPTISYMDDDSSSDNDSRAPPAPVTIELDLGDISLETVI